jgi:hypothetical protein
MGINSDNAKAVLAKISGGTNILSIPKVGTWDVSHPSSRFGYAS